MSYYTWTLSRLRKELDELESKYRFMRGIGRDEWCEPLLNEISDVEQAIARKNERIARDGLMLRAVR